MVEAIKDCGLLVLIGTADMTSWFGKKLQPHTDTIINIVLCGIAVVLTWMSFVAADYSRRDSLILFGCAAVLFYIGIQPVANSRLLTPNRD
jgi:hypothetical protein